SSEYIMKTKLSSLSGRYLIALRTHLTQRSEESLKVACGLGRRALRIGLRTLDMARIHEQALTTLSSPSDLGRLKVEMITRAEMFFSEAITPIEETHRIAMEANIILKQQVSA